MEKYLVESLLKQRCINVYVTSLRRIDVGTTLYRHHAPAAGIKQCLDAVPANLHFQCLQ